MISRRSLFTRAAAVFAGSLLARMPLAGKAAEVTKGGFPVPPNVAATLTVWQANGAPSMMTVIKYDEGGMMTINEIRNLESAWA
jgi:hypothetical protein